MTVDGVTRPLPRPFTVLATQNPVGSAGTQLLPAAQLDRFLLRLSIGYPDRASQIALMKDRHHENPLDACQAVTDAKELEAISAEAMDCYVADSVYEYVAAVAEDCLLYTSAACWSPAASRARTLRCSPADARSTSTI